MANVIVSAIAIGLIIVATTLLTQAALSSASRVTLSWDRMVRRDADIQGSGTDVDISIGNRGRRR